MILFDDYCEEVEVEGGGEEDQGIGSQTSTQTGSKRGRNTAAKGGSKRKRKMLNKDEKAQVMLSICDVNLDELLSCVQKTVDEKHITENTARRDFWTCVQSSGSSW